MGKQSYVYITFSKRDGTICAGVTSDIVEKENPEGNDLPCDWFATTGSLALHDGT